MVGDGAVGKTTLRRTYMGQSTNTNYLPTLGADISINNFTLEHKRSKYDVKIQIWDIAGQFAFNNMRPLYYKGANGIFLIYDITNISSFQNISNWIISIDKYLKLGKIPILLLGNKVDSRMNAPIQTTTEEGEKLAEKLTKTYSDGSWKIPFYETSAITGVNVNLAFEKIAKMIIAMYDKKN